MRTRRIAIRCRRTGRSAAVAIGTGTGAPVDLPVPELPPGLAVPPGPGLELPPLYGTLAAEYTPRFAVPAYLSDPPHAPGEGAPPAATRRHDVDWDRNPGWPPALGWASIAQAARGRAPRHARGRGWRMSARAAVWTGVGMVAAAVLMLVAELLR